MSAIDERKHAVGAEGTEFHCRRVKYEMFLRQGSWTGESGAQRREVQAEDTMEIIISIMNTFKSMETAKLA